MEKSFMGQEWCVCYRREKQTISSFDLWDSTLNQAQILFTDDGTY